MSGHIAPKRVYFSVFGALLVLTALTIGVAFIDLGPLNTVVALGIAFLKATLVALFFMNLRYSSRLTAMAAVAGIVWLLILFAHTLSDYMARGMLGYPGR
jgi:cytochrome c oxidase subunit 4